MLMTLAGLCLCWNVRQLMLMMLAVLGTCGSWMLVMLADFGAHDGRAAPDSHDACLFGFVLERVAVDAHDVSCFGS